MALPSCGVLPVRLRFCLALPLILGVIAAAHAAPGKTCHLPGHPGLIGRTVRVRATRAAQWGFFADSLDPATALQVL